MKEITSVRIDGSNWDVTQTSRANYDPVCDKHGINRGK